MGTGWSYFNNVCQALRVAIGVVAAACGLLVISGGWWGISQYLPHNAPDEAQVVAAPNADSSETPISNAAAPATPAVAAPVTAARSNAAAPAPDAAGTSVPPAAPAAGKQAASAASRPDFYHQNARPNPQFSGGH